MSIFKFRVSWSKANSRVVLRPIEKDTATVDKLFNILTSTNNLITEIEVDTDKNQLASIDQMKMYYASYFNKVSIYKINPFTKQGA